MANVRSHAALRVAIIPFAVAFAALLISLQLPAAVGAVLAVVALNFYIIVFFLRLPMVPTIEARVVAARKSERIGYVLLAVAVVGIIAYGVSRAV